jgi:probable addiction module antidote protein
MTNLCKEFDAAEYLTDVESLAAYLTVVLEESDIDSFKEAIDTVCRAKGMTKIAAEAQISRESLYKSLKVSTNPKFDTIFKVLESLGMRLAVVPA